MALVPKDGRTFRSKRLFPFSAVEVFSAFADPDLLAKWWGPDGFTNTFERFEFRPGGKWAFVMHGPNGINYQNDCVFGELSPHKIEIRHLGIPAFTPTITITGESDVVELDWCQVLDDPDFATKMAHIIVPSNEQNLNRLFVVLTAHCL